MKLVTFSHPGRAAAGRVPAGAASRTAIGALVPGEQGYYVLDLNRACPELPADMTGFLAAGHDAWACAAAAAAAPDAAYLIPEWEIELLAPVPRPGKILGLSLMYPDPAKPGAPLPEHPVVFGKFATSIIGPNRPIVIPAVSNQVDYEAELGVVIGRTARKVPQDEVYDYIAGYTIVNDVTARDWARHSSHWTAGKNFDTFGAIGPALVTTDEIPDPHNLEIALTVNGEEMQRENTRAMFFSIPWIVNYLSTAMTLEPGDIIFTGTPWGTMMSRQPQIWLKPGDTITITIDKLGELCNPVAAER